jgi:hypothetical protein
MKLFLLSVLISIVTGVKAQQAKQVLNDTLRIKKIEKNIEIKNKPVNKTLLAMQADIEKLVAAYSNLENTPATWVQLKTDAEKVLLKYFSNGQLAGTKPEQAFFVKVGAETMTVADIAAKK